MALSGDERALQRSQHKKLFARELRHRSTDAERILWTLLRGKKFIALRFRRQQPVGPYIADFYCSAAKLVIELDGGQHGEALQRKHDDERSQFLKSRGLRVLRFSNLDLFKHRQTVLEGIWLAVKESGAPLPEIRVPRISTLPQGEGG